MIIEITFDYACCVSRLSIDTLSRASALLYSPPFLPPGRRFAIDAALFHYATFTPFTRCSFYLPLRDYDAAATPPPRRSRHAKYLMLRRAAALYAPRRRTIFRLFLTPISIRLRLHYSFTSRQLFHICLFKMLTDICQVTACWCTAYYFWWLFQPDTDASQHDTTRHAAAPPPCMMICCCFRLFRCCLRCCLFRFAAVLTPPSRRIFFFASFRFATYAIFGCSRFRHASPPLPPLRWDAPMPRAAESFSLMPFIYFACLRYHARFSSFALRHAESRCLWCFERQRAAFSL